MSLRIIDGGANTPLATAVAAQLGVHLTERIVDRFPDGEAQVQLLGTVALGNVAIIQPTCAPGDEHLIELALLADAAKRQGASNVTAVIPYFGYARHDHDGGRAIAASAVVRIIESAGVDGAIVVDLHSRAVEAAFRIPVLCLTAVPLLSQRLAGVIPSRSVIVAPDLGAAGLADRYARALNLPVAFVRKQRVSGERVEVHGIVGDVHGRVPVIVDDMISTGTTVVAAAEACLDSGSAKELYVAASHGVFVAGAIERLSRLPLRTMFTTDSVPPMHGHPPAVQYATIADLIARAITEPFSRPRQFGDQVVKESSYAG
jgi:ribose-phosphate pyrophosphokinase